MSSSTSDTLRGVATGARPWTETDYEHLKRRYAEGAAVTTIADKLGRTQSSINVKVWKLDLKRTITPVAPPDAVPAPRPNPFARQISTPTALAEEVEALPEPEPVAAETDAPAEVEVAESPEPTPAPAPLAFPVRDPLHEIDAAIGLLRRRFDEQERELVDLRDQAERHDRGRREIDSLTAIIGQQAGLIESYQRALGGTIAPPVSPNGHAPDETAGGPDAASMLAGQVAAAEARLEKAEAEIKRGYVVIGVLRGAVGRGRGRRWLGLDEVAFDRLADQYGKCGQMVVDPGLAGEGTS